ncbi:MAG: hypothetical protein Q9160_001900 [Pyrenula sp. 1 TL-2023]
MDVRSDTSTHASGQWSMLGHGSQPWDSRSLPVSAHSGQHNAVDIERAAAFRRLQARDRTNPRRREARSIASHQSTLPTQPVIVRIHSAEASSHLQPTPRIAPVRKVASAADMSRKKELPPVSDFSIDGILNAIQPDIEETINAIAEIMGRSRLSLANQYGSHLPPQGEIRASARMIGEHALLPVEEASSSTERLADDNVFIVGEDMSVMDGSTAGSAAYTLLERLRSTPRRGRYHSSAMVSSDRIEDPNGLPRTASSPATLQQSSATPKSANNVTRARRRSNARALLQNSTEANKLPTAAVQSETYLSPGANGHVGSNPPVVSESGRTHPLYSGDEASLFEGGPSLQTTGHANAFNERLQSLLPKEELHWFLAWLQRYGGGSESSSDGRAISASEALREVLSRRQDPEMPNGEEI